MKRRSVWVVERITKESSGRWGPWTVCSSMHMGETLAHQTMYEIIRESKAGLRALIIDNPEARYRVVRYDASK